MLIAATADLHYGKGSNENAATEALADRIVDRHPDVIIIAGDVAVADPRPLVRCLRLFADCPARKLVIPGNHDLWSRRSATSADSYTIWERIFTKSSRLGGFHRLDQEPVVLRDADAGAIGFVGSIGWYDYSFADAQLDLPAESYRLKILPDESGKSFTLWNDGRFIRWRYDDPGFTRHVVGALRDHLASVKERSDAIVAVTHHVPFEQLLPDHGHADTPRAERVSRFQRAFMGSRELGAALLAEPKVRLAVCGHTHHAGAATVEHVRAVSVGSGDTEKRALFFRVAAGGDVFHDVQPEVVRV